jgi:hypothetical protein
VTRMQRLGSALLLSLSLAAPAAAGPILPTNLDVIQFGLGNSVATNGALFQVASPPRPKSHLFNQKHMPHVRPTQLERPEVRPARLSDTAG